MPTIWQDYRIGAGYNVALGSLVNIESITPVGDQRFLVVNSFGSYDPGAARVRADGTIYLAGYATVLWRLAALTFKQYEYLSTTYCSGGISGKVTIYTRLNAIGTYVRCNAILILPKLAELDKRVSAFANTALTFTRVVAL